MADDLKSGPGLRLVSDRTKGDDFESFDRFTQRPRYRQRALEALAAETQKAQAARCARPRKTLSFSEAGAMQECNRMCDYSLQSVQSRPAKVGDKVTTRDFETGTRGFSASEDASVAVCVLPGTELSFADEVRIKGFNPSPDVINHRTAIFRKINLDNPRAHHDALEFPNGELVLLTFLAEGQQATVLQLPAVAVGSKAPERAAYV
jgi:hypothetical protein